MMRGIWLFERGPGRKALQRLCKEHGVDAKVIEELVRAELDQVGRQRKRGLSDRLDDILTPAAAEAEERER